MAVLLLVEDDEVIGKALASSLRLHGHDVCWRRTGQEAMRAVREAPDLVLLDLGLPDLDGTEVCRQLRESLPSCVIVILTARSEEMDVIVGLEAGADDYLTKPLRLAELHARVRAHLRRGPATAGPQQVLTLGDLQVDIAGRRVSFRGHDVSLRAKEFDLLARLASEPDVAVSRDTLMVEVWDEHWFGSTKTLDVHVAALRRKLDNAAHGARSMPRIATLRGHGYRLEAPIAPG
jgi:DNA-binding response OmpR family regulator